MIEKLNISDVENGKPLDASIINKIRDKANEIVAWINAYEGEHSQGNDIANSTIVGLKTKYTYMGEPIEPNVQIVLGNKVLSKENYLVDYRNNDGIGTATVKYIGLFPYTGELEASFDIEGMRYNLTHNLEGGTGNPIGGKVSVLTAENLATPTKADYTFEGWYYPNGAKANTGDVLTEDTLLTAKWVANAFTLRYETNGHGSVVQPTGKQSVIPALPTLDESGYAFGGWYYDNDTFEQKATKGEIIREDTTLYARWASLQPTFVIEGNTLTASCDNDAGIVLKQDGEAIEGNVVTLNKATTITSVVIAFGNEHTCVITATYDKDNETIDVASTAGDVTVVKNGSPFSMPIVLYNTEGEMVAAGTYTIVDEASNTASIKIIN